MNHKYNFKELEKKIGYQFKDKQLLKKAMTHSSYTNEKHIAKIDCNERLEFLGDAVLDATVGHIVYDHFPGKREGFLTNTRSKLVQRETLGRLAKEMGIT